MYPPLQYHTEQFHGPKIPLHSVCSFLPPSLATTDLFCLHSFAFSRIHVIVFTQYVIFTDWLLSLAQSL